jgi:hypothetical protein
MHFTFIQGHFLKRVWGSNAIGELSLLRAFIIYSTGCKSYCLLVKRPLIVALICKSSSVIIVFSNEIINDVL